jgi:2-polyprenyl-3-methyl-5-hydroxy-6-metoxy-1,4-benzoquinol methylase
MFDYRKTLYQNYYSNHAGVKGKKAQKAHFKQQRRYFKREFKSLLPADKAVAILDIGCGSGSFLSAIGELGYSNYRGIDLSQEQVEMAREFGVRNVECAEAKDFLSLQQEAFDVICAIDLIEHLSKDELISFLKVVKTALRPGGKVIFRTPNMDARQASVFAFADFTHEVFLNKSSATQVLLSTGYENIDVVEGFMFMENPAKEFTRKLLWMVIKFCLKLELFATARTWHEVVFTPNIVITGHRPI